MNIEYLDSLGTDLTPVNCARVSMDKHHDVFDQDTDARLINYLAREGHWTPLAAPQIQVRITAPIFIARQWFRHTVGVVRSEVSRRYVNSFPKFYMPETWRSRPEGNIKQGSGDNLDPDSQNVAHDIYEMAMLRAESDYRALIDLNVAPEQARMLLPQSMYTTWIETGSLVYWSRVYNLRVDAHAQKEIRDLALQLDDIIRPLFPVSWEALVHDVKGSL